MTLMIKCLAWPLLTLLLSCTTGETSSHTISEGKVLEGASMASPRSGHTATLLPNGRVMIAGGMNGNGSYSDGVEIFDPAANSFTATRNMSAQRVGHTATLLPDGKVLIAGGFHGEYVQGAELYDPATTRFSPTGPLNAPRSDHVAVLLGNGKVLLIGGVGVGYSFLATAEIYDPATGKFTSTGNMATAREGHTATLLKNGKVLVAGGHKDRRESMTVFSSAELYDPATGRFTATGDMTVVRHKHAAVLLPDGNILIAGGSDKRDSRGQYASAEIYESEKGAFKSIGNMNSARYKLAGAMVLLQDGRALVAGGSPRVELYDPAKKSFAVVNGELDSARFFSSATLLNDGRVLIAGGYGDHGAATTQTWVYKPLKVGKP
jgi:galactose oxidase-like protein/Kelch motif protein